MNQTIYNVLLGITGLVAVLFILLVFITGKGDAMSSGGGGVRTTFKGKASFEDQISRWIMGLGLSFVGLTILLDVLAQRLK